MPITEREYDNLKEMIEDHMKSIDSMLKLRKDYWDERITKICNSISEMKNHCMRQQDGCHIMFKDFDKRIDENTENITKIKTVGGVLAFVWGALVTIATQFMRRIG